MNNIIGSKIIHVDETDSTNDYAVNLLKEDLPQEGTLIITNFQKKGKGQRTNHWESKKGENILLSTILYPEFIAIEEQFMISKFVSLSIYEFLNQYINNISIKWPNDIYYKDKKIAGILIENMIQGSIINHTIVGMGININQAEFSKELINPISLKIITSQTYKIEKLIEELIVFLNNRYKQLSERNMNKINNDYLTQLYRLNKNHFFKIQNEIFEGRIIGVSNIGRLIIERKSGKKQEFNFKEVEF